MTHTDHYSLIMTGYTGTDVVEFEAAARRALGQPGMDLMSLVISAQRHLPAELADDLSRADAERIAAKLLEAGATVDTRRSDDVGELRHRAAELRADRVAGEYSFTEVDGMILEGPVLGVRDNLEQMRQRTPPTTPWQHEIFQNHDHPGEFEPPRARVRLEHERVAQMAAALQEAYPDRIFTVVHCPCDMVTFFQGSPDVLKKTDGKAEPDDGLVWCQTCGTSQPLGSVSGPEPELAEIEWGTCAVCGGDVLAQDRVITRTVGEREPTSGSGADDTDGQRRSEAGHLGPAS